MKTKIVTAYWMDVEGYPFQGTRSSLKPRYLGSLISHCKGINFPIICYTHSKNYEELLQLKHSYQLSNLEIKLFELSEMKFHKEISKIRDVNFDTDLSGRGPEIMWGKFEVMEKELDNCDRLYWIDCGLQHPGIFPWMYCVPYGDIEYHRGGVPVWVNNEISQYDFTKLFNTKIFEILNKKTENKVFNITSTNPQIGYKLHSLSIDVPPIYPPYPIGGMIGGDSAKLRVYLNTFWNVCSKVLEKNYLCTEEELMKPTFDICSDIMIDYQFSVYQTNEQDDFHFNVWSEKSNKPKPLYMVWNDILSEE
jgi:hypothetical protein